MEVERTRKRDIIKRKLKSLTERDILKAMKETFDNAYVFFKRKLGDYGVEVYKAAGGIGIVTRMREKFARMDNLMRKRDDPNFESVRDTIQDISVYSATLLAMIDKGVIDLEELQEQYIAVYGETEVIDEDEVD